MGLRRNKEQQKHKAKSKSQKYPKQTKQYEQNNKETIHQKQKMGQDVQKPWEL